MCHTRHPQEHHHSLLAPLYAASCGLISDSLPRIPRRTNLLSGTLGKVDAKELELHTMERRPPDLYWAAICSSSNGWARFSSRQWRLILSTYHVWMAGYTVTRILQRFERIDNSRWDEGAQKIKCEVVISPADGVKVGFWDAKGKAGHLGH